MTMETVLTVVAGILTLFSGVIGAKYKQVVGEKGKVSDTLVLALNKIKLTEIFIKEVGDVPKEIEDVLAMIPDDVTKLDQEQLNLVKNELLDVKKEIEDVYKAGKELLET